MVGCAFNSTECVQTMTRAKQTLLFLMLTPLHRWHRGQICPQTPWLSPLGPSPAWSDRVPRRTSRRQRPLLAPAPVPLSPPLPPGHLPALQWRRLPLLVLFLVLRGRNEAQHFGAPSPAALQSPRKPAAQSLARPQASQQLLLSQPGQAPPTPSGSAPLLLLGPRRPLEEPSHLALVFFLLLIIDGLQPPTATASLPQPPFGLQRGPGSRASAAEELVAHPRPREPQPDPGAAATSPALCPVRPGWGSPTSTCSRSTRTEIR